MRTITNHSRLHLLTILCVFATTWSAPAQTSATIISFQGALSGPNGQPLPNGNYSLSFRFWDGPAPGGNPVSTNIVVSNVPVAGGVASTSIPVDPTWFTGQTRYLGVTIGSGIDLLPRLLVTAVPYSITTRGITVNPPPRFDPPIVLPRNRERVVIGNTTEDISRVPPVDQALVIGTPNGAAGAKVGIYFDTLSRADSAIIIEKTGATNIENNSMSFYVGSEDAIASKRAMSINPPPRFEPAIVLPRKHDRVVIGNTTEDISRVPPVDQALVIGTANSAQGAKVGIYFDTMSRANSAIIVEKTSGGEDSSMAFYVGREGVPLAENIMTASATRLDINGTMRSTVVQITSDRKAKRDFKSVSGADVLAKLAALPITTWVYTNAPSIRHIGPVAQDFKAAFGFSDDDKHIASVDADGVALAAIQGLNEKLEETIKEKDGRIAALEERLVQLENLIQRSPVNK